ncbi:MAG: class Ib ribonucleoside-diphosphate reductase assembly flavoprotein NrdI [Acholeplasma sp.]|nr:class Ib ribonucleoside-diphosphate reductase assembly flavoprotein NrdI [Acholeplasma sp.]
MLIIYDSNTGNSKSFSTNLSKKAIAISLQTYNEPILLVTHTVGLGKVTKKTLKFLKLNAHNVKGIVVSGEARFKKLACLAADKIIEKYPQISLVTKTEKEGTPNDLILVKEWINEIKNARD